MAVAAAAAASSFWIDKRGGGTHTHTGRAAPLFVHTAARSLSLSRQPAARLLLRVQTVYTQSMKQTDTPHAMRPTDLSPCAPNQKQRGVEIFAVQTFNFGEG